MANTVAPFGFRPVASLTGNGEYIRTMTHVVGDAEAIGKWDLVVPTGTADTVAQLATTQGALGVALNYVAASTAGSVGVMFVNHNTVMEAQEDSVGGNIAAASEGLNCTAITPNASTTTGLSQMSLDSSSVATTSTLDVRLLQPSPRVGNIVAEAYTLWFCSPLNTHIGQAVAGI